MRAETFLSMFRVLEGLLGRKYADQNRKCQSVVMAYLQDAESEPVRQQLDLCREVRNLLTHNADAQGGPIIEPSQALLDSLYDIISYVQKPQPALMFATRAEAILQAHPNDRALEVMRRMNRHGFSHAPVIDDGRICGVFSVGTVFARCLDGGEICPDTRICEFGALTKLNTRFMFMDERATYLDARAEFEKRSGRNNRLAAIFITSTGDENGALMGLLTPWDVMRDMPD